MTNLNNLQFNWDSVGSVPPEKLVTAREQLHHAVQLIAAAGKYLIPERSDDSHTSLHWNEVKKAFEGETIGEQQAFHVGLRPADLTLYIRDKVDNKSSDFILKDNTIDLAFTWMKGMIEKKDVNISELSLKMHYDIPSNPVSEGEKFKFENSDHFSEIGRYFANANQILLAIKNIIPEAAHIRCWPHHFDIATLITINKDNTAEEARSIGIGFTPGDGGYTEPYFYITPWPYPDLQKITLPTLSAGNWHSEGWVGGVLKASEICSHHNQSESVGDFMKSGITASAEILDHDLIG
jgi:hypothetical protein